METADSCGKLTVYAKISSSQVQFSYFYYKYTIIINIIIIVINDIISNYDSIVSNI